MANLQEIDIPADVKQKLEKGDELMKKQVEASMAKYESGDNT